MEINKTLSLVGGGTGEQLRRRTVLVLRQSTEYNGNVHKAANITLGKWCQELCRKYLF